jgi:integrase
VKVYRQDVAQGSIEPLRTGFRARVFAGRDPITGRKIYLRGETRRVRRDAEADRDRLLAQVEADQHPDQHATVSVLLDRWMEVVDHELSTASTTAGYIRRTLKPTLGDMPLRKLQHRVDILDRLYTHLRRCNRLCDSAPARRPVDDGTEDSHMCRPMSPSAVRRVHAILSAALNFAVSWGWIERNPADYAHPPKLPRRRALPPRPEQVAELLNAAAAADDELAVFLWLAVTSGARRGELVALRWTDVALDRGLLRLDSNYVVRDGQRRLKGTKTDDERWLSVDALTVEMLEALRAARAVALEPAGLMLPLDAFVLSPDPLGGRPWHPDHFTHAYRALADELGVVEPLKNLRHFNATQLLAAGIDLRTTAGRLGHSDGGATTLRHYANWTRPADQRAAELLASDLTALRHQAAAAAAPSTSGRVPRAIARTRRPASQVLPELGAVRTYIELAKQLRVAIAAGRLAPGDLLPTVPDIAGHCGLARSTVSRALGLLAQQAVIVRNGTRWATATDTGEAATA